MTTNDYIPVDALKYRIDVIRDYYQDLLNTCVRYGNSSDEYTYQGVLKALNELEEQIDEMKVSL